MNSFDSDSKFLTCTGSYLILNNVFRDLIPTLKFTNFKKILKIFIPPPPIKQKQNKTEQYHKF